MTAVGRIVSPPISISLGLESDQSLADLQSLGENLSKGTYHGAVLWGTEYGWLRKRHPDFKLEPLVTVYNGADVWYVTLFVQRQFCGEQRGFS